MPPASSPKAFEFLSFLQFACEFLSLGDVADIKLDGALVAFHISVGDHLGMQFASVFRPQRQIVKAQHAPIANLLQR